MKKSIERRMILITSLGSILEYYDFVVYGMLAKYLKAIFFPGGNDVVSALQFFSVFAIGYFARPFGGVIAGIIGDCFGRKPAFFFLTLLMAMSTLLIGFLPDFSKIGFVATVLLILCRVGQGLSFGGELPGAATIVGEFSPRQSRGGRVSFIVASTSVGALIASFVLFNLTSFLTEPEIIAWGWRIPFVIGGLFGIVLCWFRKTLMETPVFKSENIEAHQHKPLKELVRHQSPSVLAGIMLTIFSSAMIISNLYFPYYMNQYFYYSEKNIYLAATVSLIFSALILPFAGQLADRMSKSLLLKCISGSYFVLSFFLFKLLYNQDFYLLILFMIVHQLFIALFLSCYYPIIINLFPTKVRYTGIAACYNLVYAFMGILPTFLTMLLNQFQTPLVVPFVLSIMAAISFIGICWIEKIEIKRNNTIFANAVSA